MDVHLLEQKYPTILCQYEQEEQSDPENKQSRFHLSLNECEAYFCDVTDVDNIREHLCFSTFK